MEFHEAANIFPMDEENLPALAEDIRTGGQQVEIETCGGKILDGRRRFKACELAGVKPKTREVNPPDPVAYVVSLNLHRRHLDVSQRAMVGARAKELRDKFAAEARERQRAGGGDRKSARAKSVQANLPEPITGQTRESIGKLVNVGGKSIDAATKVLDSGTPELVRAVDDGEMSVHKAAKVANRPAEEQHEAIAKTKDRTATTTPETASVDAEESEGSQEPADTERDQKLRGKAVEAGVAAVNALKKISRNNPHRKLAYQQVRAFMRSNP